MITVDDTNTIQLKYDDKWFHGNWTDTSTQPPSNKSLLSSNDVTAQLVLVFPAAGTGFSYYGMKRSGGGRFRICIDCDPNQPAGPFDIIDALNETDDGHNPPALLYSKQGLPNDMHTVVLMNTNDTRLIPQGASQITLDRFEITTQAPPVVTSTVTNSAQGSATAPVIINASQSQGASINAGVIAGVVIGALALMALMIGLLLCWRRKRRLARSVSVEDGRTPKDASMPNPLVVDESISAHRPNLGSILTLSTKGSLPGVPPRDTVESSSLRTGSGAPASTSTPITSPTTVPLTNRRMETDAGPVRDDGDTLPPDYAQVFNSRLQPGSTASVSLGVVSDQNDEPQRHRKRS